MNSPIPKPSGPPPRRVSVLETTRIVFAKESRDHLRDRRSVLGALLLPLFGPAVLVAAVRFQAQLQDHDDPSLAVMGAANAPALLAAMEGFGIDSRTLQGVSAEEAVTTGTALVVLVIPDDYSSRVAEGATASLRLVFDSSKPKSATFVQRVQGVLSQHIQTLGALRLMARGVSPIVAHPVRIEPVDVATPEQIAAQLLTVVPIMLMLAAIVGGLNVAIDTTAGERERHSLEPLLLNPAPRLGIVAGKWLTVTVAGILVSSLAALAFFLIQSELPLEKLGLRARFGISEVLNMLLWVAPLAAVGAALQMLIASLAKTFKEAQTYLSLFVLLPTLPAMFLMFSPMGNTWWACLIPAFAQVTAILDLLKGAPIPIWHVALTWAACLTYTAIVLLGLEHLLRREQTVFGR